MHQSITAFILATAVLAVSASYLGHFDEYQDESKKDYQYDYSVHDPHHDGYHSHQESSKDGVVRGYYSVKEADGSLREVHYTADPKEGFKAIVTKNGVQVDPPTGGHEQQHYQDEEETHGLEHFGQEQFSEHHF